MSVIYYCAAELADFALAGTVGSVHIRHDEMEATLDTLAEALADYSVANVAAVNASYREERAPHTKVEILEAMCRSRATVDVLRRRTHGRRAVSGLAYNAVAQDGHNYLEDYPKAALGLADVLTAIVRVLVDESRLSVDSDSDLEGLLSRLHHRTTMVRDTYRVDETAEDAIEFPEAMAAYVAAIERKIDEHWEQRGYTATVPKPVIELMRGRRYVRVVRAEGVNARSVHSFVDLTSGDILKPAGWSGPAKHARGNIYDLDNAQFNHFGPAYLR